MEWSLNGARQAEACLAQLCQSVVIPVNKPHCFHLRRRERERERERDTEKIDQ